MGIFRYERIGSAVLPAPDSFKTDAIPSRQQRYRMNPNVAKQVKEELDRLLKVGFIPPIENPDWISPIVIVPKKNKKLRICVDYRKLNAATVPDPFPLPLLGFFQIRLLALILQGGAVFCICTYAYGMSMLAGISPPFCRFPGLVSCISYFVVSLFMYLFE